jgi:outer membrane receptor protein involved in Fe transport
MTSAQASDRLIDVPAGTVSEAAIRLGRQVGVSIAIRDPAAAARYIPAIRGRMAPSIAVAHLAFLAGTPMQTAGARSFVLATAAPSPTRVKGRRPARTATATVIRSPEPLVTNPDIIVTASKRDTRLRHFAGQWSAVIGSDLKGWGPTGSEAIEARNIAFSSTHLGAGRNKLFIRGIGDSSFSGPTQSPVGQYVGDVRTTYSGTDPDLQLVDMRSVEILEGPQGSLYGAGSLGGTILLRPNDPEAGTLSGNVAVGASLTQHGAPGIDLSAVLNAPIGDGAVRLVGYDVSQGGYIDNRANGERDTNRTRIRGARGVVALPLKNDWTIKLGGLAQRIRGDDSQYADADGPPLTRFTPVDMNFSSDFNLASVSVERASGRIRARATVGAVGQRVVENFDASRPAESRRLSQTSSASAVTSETRVWRPMSEGYSWLWGFSALSQRYDVERELSKPTGRLDLAGAASRTRETTLFAEFAAKLAPEVVATVGARWTRTNLAGTGRHISPTAAQDRFHVEAERTETRLLPAASLLANPTDKLTLYVRYQRGFRPGGLSLDNDLVRRYLADRLVTVEAGFRLGQILPSAIALAGSVTHSDWTNVQADFIDGAGLPSTANIGNGRVWTATLKAVAGMAKGATAELGVAWNDGKIVQPSASYAAALRSRGAEIPNIARFVARIGADWSGKVGDSVELRSSMYLRYVGRSRLGIGPELGRSQGNYLDSGISVRAGNNRRAFSLTASNLTDQIGNRFALGTPIALGHEQITPLRPRSIRLGFEAGF